MIRLIDIYIYVYIDRCIHESVNMIDAYMIVMMMIMVLMMIIIKVTDTA